MVPGHGLELEWTNGLGGVRRPAPGAFGAPVTSTPAKWTPVDERMYEQLVAAGRTSRHSYILYIVSFALIDLLALLRLIPEVATWVHVLITLLLAACAVVAISLSVALSARASSMQQGLLLHLLRAHNERAAELRATPR